MLSEAICWILINNYSVPHLIHLLDDFLIISPPDAIPAENITTVQRIFAELGVPIAQEKSLGPTQLIEFLGINLDSVKFQASLPKEKIDRIILVASSFAEGHNCSKCDLLSLLGHLNLAMRIIPQGRPFNSHMLALASSVHALDDQIIINLSRFMGSRSRPHRVLSVCVCVCVSRCLWVCVIEANSLQLRVITIGLYQFLSRSPSCQILAVCGRRLRGVSGSWFPRFLSPAAFLDSDRRRLVCPLLPCATRLSPYGKLRFCLRKAPLLPTESSASAYGSSAPLPTESSV